MSLVLADTSVWVARFRSGDLMLQSLLAMDQVMMAGSTAMAIDEPRCTGVRADDASEVRRYEEHLKKLQDALARAGLRWHGEPVWARFDPPWKPWLLRRNEIWLMLD